MHGFLLRMIQRQLRRLAVGTTLGMAIVTMTAVVSGQFESLAIEEAGLAGGKAQPGTGDGCESLAVKPGAGRPGDTRIRTGAAHSCAAGEVDLGDHRRPAGKSADRVILKQRN